MIRAIIVALTATLALAGCADVEATVASVEDTVTGKTTDDLEEYQAELRPLARKIDRLDRQYASVQGENYTTDLKMYRVVSRILPKYTVLLDDVEMIEVDNAEIRDAHDTLIEALQSQQRGLTLALAALDYQDYEKLAEANDALSESRSLGREYLRVIEEIEGE